MEILNVRLGFATNSSSTHSIIFLPKGKKVTDDLVDNSEFGWDFFTAASSGAKRNYLAHIIFSALSDQSGDDIARTVAEAWSGGSLSGGYIDHQSMPSIPLEWNGKGIDKSFVDDFRSFLEREDVAILGGNDNTDESHPLLDGADSAGYYRSLPMDQYRTSWVARKDSRGYWTMFNRKGGQKIRVAFPVSRGSMSYKADRADVPELVDVKITDYCPFEKDCPWCYQGSTTSGKHASLDSLRSLAEMLGKLRVFEVALGGGEPTTHPDFEEIIDAFDTNGVRVNFTTKNVKWVKSHPSTDPIWKKIGAIAFSVNDRKSADTILPIIKERDLTQQVTVQTILRPDLSSYDLEYLLRSCGEIGVTVTLLGFKESGRGLAYSKSLKTYRGTVPWVDLLKNESSSVRVGIDTALADAYWDELIAAGVPDWCMHRKEGKFSCYVDAVAQRMAPSSYCDGSLFKPVSMGNDYEGKSRKMFASTFQSF